MNGTSTSYPAGLDWDPVGLGWASVGNHLAVEFLGFTVAALAGGQLSVRTGSENPATSVNTMEQFSGSCQSRCHWASSAAAPWDLFGTWSARMAGDATSHTAARPSRSMTVRRRDRSPRAMIPRSRQDRRNRPMASALVPVRSGPRAPAATSAG
jgi:hypothetical protein